MSNRFRELLKFLISMIAAAVLSTLLTGISTGVAATVLVFSVVVAYGLTPSQKNVVPGSRRLYAGLTRQDLLKKS